MLMKAPSQAPMQTLVKPPTSIQAIQALARILLIAQVGAKRLFSARSTFDLTKHIGSTRRCVIGYGTCSDTDAYHVSQLMRSTMITWKLLQSQALNTHLGPLSDILKLPTENEAVDMVDLKGIHPATSFLRTCQDAIPLENLQYTTSPPSASGAGACGEGVRGSLTFCGAWSLKGVTLLKGQPALGFDGSNHSNHGASYRYPPSLWRLVVWRCSKWILMYPRTNKFKCPPNPNHQPGIPKHGFSCWLPFARLQPKGGLLGTRAVH